eukprot:Lithocolla_globosa_v1_NODE_4276_length_1473_cov_17.421721.p1 type:complete len:173 gc:universal NODE_4276_length_1473_cov_17.421721:888-1406(+)
MVFRRSSHRLFFVVGFFLLCFLTYSAYTEVRRRNIYVGKRLNKEPLKPSNQLNHTKPDPNLPEFVTVNNDHLQTLHGTYFGLGEDGEPTWKPELLEGFHETHEDKVKHHTPNNFNLARSDRLPMNRPLTDSRHRDCPFIHYPYDLPDTSVVIVFYNEPISTLLRSVHTVLNR